MAHSVIFAFILALTFSEGKSYIEGGSQTLGMLLVPYPGDSVPENAIGPNTGSKMKQLCTGKM